MRIGGPCRIEHRRPTEAERRSIAAGLGEPSLRIPRNTETARARIPGVARRARLIATLVAEANGQALGLRTTGFETRASARRPRLATAGRRAIFARARGVGANRGCRRKIAVPVGPTRPQRGHLRLGVIQTRRTDRGWLLASAHALAHLIADQAGRAIPSFTNEAVYTARRALTGHRFAHQPVQLTVRTFCTRALLCTRHAEARIRRAQAGRGFAVVSPGASPLAGFSDPRKRIPSRYGGRLDANSGRLRRIARQPRPTLRAGARACFSLCHQGSAHAARFITLAFERGAL